MKTQHTVRTKLNKDDANPVVTVLTVDWAGTTAEMLQGPAADTLVINLQGGWRRNKKIPQVLEVKAADLIARMGSRSMAPETVETLGAKATAMTREERDRLIAILAAADKADKAAAKGGNKNAPPKGDGDKSKGANAS